MLMMAEAYGADVRLVAFMQYLRVLFVASLATLVAHFSGHQGTVAAHAWFEPVPLLLPLTLARTTALHHELAP